MVLRYHRWKRGRSTHEQGAREGRKYVRMAAAPAEPALAAPRGPAGANNGSGNASASGSGGGSSGSSSASGNGSGSGIGSSSSRSNWRGSGDKSTPAPT